MRGCSFGLIDRSSYQRPLAGHVFCSVENFGLFLVPSNLILASGALGLGLIFSKRWRLGGWLLACCVAALLICGFSPLGALMLLPLETRFSRWDPDTGDPAGIIVLGGGLDPEMTTARGTPAINSSGARIVVAAELAYRYPKARLVYVGGNSSLRSANLQRSRLPPRAFSRTWGSARIACNWSGTREIRTRMFGSPCNLSIRNQGTVAFGDVGLPCS